MKTCCKEIGQLPTVGKPKQEIIMTKEEAIAELNLIRQSDDTEVAHVDADDVLCQLLMSLGYEDVVTAYHNIGKWYA